MVEQLSCTTCRIRKTRCNRLHPCQHCQRGLFECTFPTGRRRPRDSRRLLALRLENIESKFTALAQALSPGSVDHTVFEPRRSRHLSVKVVPSLDVECEARRGGLLSVSADQSRYSSSRLWCSLGEEIAEMRELLDDENVLEDRKPAQPLPFLGGQENPTGLPLTQRPSDLVLSESNQIDQELLWHAYDSNVAPLVTIFHKPSLKALHDSRSTRESSSRMRAVCCAVDFAAIVSLIAEDRRPKISQNKTQILKHYRYAVEQALSEAGLLNTTSLSVLQAFVLYLTSIRRCDDTWLVLSWTGVAVRVALSLGLHRDGAKLGLDSFSTEIRRRLWWHLMLMEADLSEAHGVVSLLRDISYDAQMPMNLDDVEIWPGMTTAFKSRNGFTDMTPSIVRYEIMLASRKMLLRCNDRVSPVSPNAALDSSNDDTQAITELQELLEARYLRHCSAAVPIQGSTQQVVQIKCKMLRFGVSHVLGRKEESGSASDVQAIRDGILAVALDIVDKVCDLEVDPKSRQWGWYFRGDTHWPALVYLLNEVIQRSASPWIDRAWSVVKHARKQYHAGQLPEPDGTHRACGMLFRPMRELTAKAFVIKDAEAQLDIDHRNFGSQSNTGGANLTSTEASGPQEICHPFLSELRAPVNVVDDNDTWPPDHMPAFQEFWRSSGPDISASSQDVAHSSLFARRQTFENLLL